MAKMVVLRGYGMCTPRLGEAYTMTIISATVMDGSEILETYDDSDSDRQRFGTMLNRTPFRPKEDHPYLPFSYTFSKVMSLEDTSGLGRTGCIKVKGISPRINGCNVVAELSFPPGYDPPAII